ncbi:MAG: DUF1127 domain-containing protein [Phyllobacterium sp.]|uniref:DUF1127 domain-containing protein n=1 Tax=Phyllobacterium sp. TaxID=1871046 RepID=UPI0030F29672
MAHTHTQTGRSASKKHLFKFGLNGLAKAIAALADWRRTVATRSALADLSPDQLKDIGHPQANRAVLDIKAGLITNLMSMR